MTLRRQKYKDREGVHRQSEKWYGDFYDHRGVRRRLALFPDRKNASEAARSIERLVGIRASGEMIPAELHRFIENTRPDIREKLAYWGIIDASRLAVVVPLTTQIAEWRKSLLNKGTSIEHVDLITS